MLDKIKFWLIRKLAGKKTIIMNIEIDETLHVSFDKNNGLYMSNVKVWDIINHSDIPLDNKLEFDKGFSNKWNFDDK